MFLDDDLLFSKVGCAREIAKFSLVCKRWRDLSCSVSYLDFQFDTATKEELENKEGIISSVLSRANSRAPGSLKHLRVSLKCDHLDKASGDWLLCTPSLTRLDLIGQWGPVVLNTIMRMKTVEDLRLGTYACTRSQLLHANGFQMTRLRKCFIIGLLSVAMLETILATCPALEDLCTACDQGSSSALRVVSNSLQILSLSFLCTCDRVEVTVEAPSLRILSLRTRATISTVYFESARSLCSLGLHFPWILHNPPDSLRELDITGTYDFQQLSQMLMLTPMITGLSLDITGEGKINIDHVLAPLVNLRNIELSCNAMLRFKSGERRLEALRVHVWPSSEFFPNVPLLRALLEVHKIQRLVVHSQAMMNYDTRTVNTEHKNWLFLFELSVFYPERVKFTRKGGVTCRLT